MMLTKQDNGQAVLCRTINGMMKLLEKYYNINSGAIKINLLLLNY